MSVPFAQYAQAVYVFARLFLLFLRFFRQIRFFVAEYVYARLIVLLLVVFRILGRFFGFYWLFGRFIFRLLPGLFSRRLFWIFIRFVISAIAVFAVFQFIKYVINIVGRSIIILFAGALFCVSAAPPAKFGAKRIQCRAAFQHRAEYELNIFIFFEIFLVQMVYCRGYPVFVAVPAVVEVVHVCRELLGDILRNFEVSVSAGVYHEKHYVSAVIVYDGGCFLVVVVGLEQLEPYLVEVASALFLDGEQILNKADYRSLGAVFQPSDRNAFKAGVVEIFLPFKLHIYIVYGIADVENFQRLDYRGVRDVVVVYKLKKLVCRDVFLSVLNLLVKMFHAFIYFSRR